MPKHIKKQQKPDNQIAFYQAPDGGVKIEVLYADENIWLTQKLMAQLYDVSVPTINEHLKNIFGDHELDEGSVIRNFRITAADGKTYDARHYALEAIIAVGYRVGSGRGIQFRQWATKILQNYIHKGFALDSDRFKYGSRFDRRFFDDLLEEIRDIRSSERVAYQKITDIYATSIDYSPAAADTKAFFATVQNKLHFAITGKTAAEIVSERASSAKPHMGLTSWRRSPEGKIMPSDVIIAKNYLGLKELDHLNRIVSMYLDYAELQAVRGRPMYMRDWIAKLNAFLKFNEHEILNDAGQVSREVAATLAMKEYEKYRKEQDKNYVSDFDRDVKKIIRQSAKRVRKKG
jgi:hypothetical protein